MIKHFVVTLPSYVYNQLKEKCHFYDIPLQEVTSSLLIKFIDGEFDEYFGINQLKDNEVSKES
jgi:hypothetical protein